jgi:hypothetical protein
MSRIFLHPGIVTSKRDGQRHMISSRQLANLYGVDYSKCIVMYDGKSKPWPPEEGDIHLYPDYHGRYNKVEVK